MSTSALRSLAITLILFTPLTFAGCGSGARKVCNAAHCCGVGSDACIAPQFLYAAGVNGQIAAFPVTQTGGLGTPTFTAGPAMTLGMAALNHQFLYLSNPQFGVGGTSSIDAWSITLGTGALSTVSGSPFSLGPFSLGAGLATNGAAQVLYVADAGKIDALKVDSTGALSTVLGSPFPAGTNLFLAVDPSNHFLFASDDTPPGNILAFTIDPSNGALTAVAGSPFAPIPNFVGDTTPFGVAVDSTGSFVYSVLQSTGQVAAFSIVAPGGALDPVPGSPFAAGKGPLSIATVKNFVYVSNALDGTISGYTITSGSGVLAPISGSPFPIPGTALSTDPAGRFLYASSAAGVLAFTIDPTTGALNSIAGSPFPSPGATVLTFVQ